MPYGVSNSFRRGILRTYTRQPQRVRADEDEAIPRKRIRMDDTGIIHEEPTPFTEQTQPDVDLSAPSSPVSKHAVFSDPPRQSSATPPSSPPPRVATPPAISHKPAFSFLNRKRARHSGNVSTAEPLTEIPLNDANARKKQPPAKKARFTQMQIDLGGEIGRTCKGCGMDYIPSNAEDAGLHKEFHSMNIGGVDMGRGFSKDPAAPVVSRFGEGEQVVMVDGKSALGIRNKVKKVLEVANLELGAIDIADGDLWGKMPPLESEDNKKGEKKRALRTGKPEEQEGRFKAFLYLSGDKCIGLCLAERIRSASKVVDSAGTHEVKQENVAVVRSSSIMTETSQNLALLGISRIWTSKSHRRKGIASALLNCASNHFFYGIEVPKELIAFSQPTESGGQLAEGWFGERAGWHVYAEN
ncbi:N-acetyltransferase O1 (Establishment of cohesion protein 1) [Trapelia coarctata]|nr:N-acetyltransferase O1 (Establishment of cohesion protein 1) [Trapelia coarctata]